MLLRDGESNMKEACEDWGTTHFLCIGYPFYLEVAPILQVWKTPKDLGENDGVTRSKNIASGLVEDDDDELYVDSFDTEGAIALKVWK